MRCFLLCKGGEYIAREIKSGIYKIENTVNGKVYVGQTKDLKRRKTSHFCDLRYNRHHNCHLQNAFNKYGENAFRFEVIEYCHETLLNSREAYWVNILHAQEPEAGYNIIDGGAGGNKKWNTQEVICLNTGFYFPSIFEASKIAGVHRSTISSCLKGETYSAGEYNGKRLVWVYLDDYKKMTSAEIKERVYNAQNSHVNNSKTTAVVLLNTGEEYFSIHNASQSVGVSSSSIINSCTGKASFGGKDSNGNHLFWMYASMYHDLTEEERKNILQNLKTGVDVRKTNKPVILVNTGEIFESVKIAAKAYKFSKNTISSCCNRKTKYCKKKGRRFLWMFYDDYISASNIRIKRLFQIAMKSDMGGTNPKAVVLINTGESFRSVLDAAQCYKINTTSIINACKNPSTHKSIAPNGKSLYWMYKSDYEKLSDLEIRKYLNCRLQEYSGQNHDKIILLNTLEIFPTFKDAGEKYGVSNSSISKCCRYQHCYSAGKSDSGDPLIWMFLSEYEKMTSSEIDRYIHMNTEVALKNNKRQIKKVILLNTLEIFSSRDSASKAYNLHPDSISRCCRGKSKTGGRHPITGERLRWMYYDDYLKAKPNGDESIA